MKIAFIFPGQGSQYVGMAKEFIENFPESKEVFDRANTALGYDLASLCINGPVEKLNLTENTKPAILAASMAILQPLVRRGLTASVDAGHSLGGYTEITATDGFESKILSCSSKKGDDSCRKQCPLDRDSWPAILGMDRKDVEKTCLEAANNGIVAPANYNSPGQIVIAGEKLLSKGQGNLQNPGVRERSYLSQQAFHRTAQ